MKSTSQELVDDFTQWARDEGIPLSDRLGALLNRLAVLPQDARKELAEECRQAVESLVACLLDAIDLIRSKA
jgi:hypothetical protein